MSASIIENDLDVIVAADLPWSRLPGKQILVTGASGMVGAYLVEAMLHLRSIGLQPPHVTGLVRNLEKAQKRFSHYSTGELRLVRGDVTRPLDLSGAFDFIIHAASPASPKFYSLDPVGTLLSNIIGTQQLLELARRTNAEGLLLLSSGEMYGEAPVVPTAESDYGYLDPVSYRSCYAESKRMAETMCVAWQHQYGVRAFVARLFHTYGPGMSLDDGRVFADFVSDIVSSRNIVVKSDGSAKRAFCYITDAVIGLLTVLLRGEPGLPYNVGNDEAELSILELAELLAVTFSDRGCKVVMDSSRRAPEYVQSPILRNCPDTSRLRQLNWRPTIAPAEGFKRTVLSFTDHMGQGHDIG